MVHYRIHTCLCEHFVTWYVFMVSGCYSLAQPLAGGTPLVGCPCLLIQNIRSYLPYCNLRKRDTVVTGTYLNTDIIIFI
jgi:hypothetical protein